MMTSGMAVANCDGDTNLAVHEWLCNPVTSSRRPGHRPPAQQVEVQMKYRLAPVGVGVHHHSVAPLGDAGVARSCTAPAVFTSSHSAPCCASAKKAARPTSIVYQSRMPVSGPRRKSVHNASKK